MLQDYREMVNTVKLLKKETASWRAVVNWPQLDEQFKPDDLSLVMKEDRVYPGMYRCVWVWVCMCVCV